MLSSPSSGDQSVNLLILDATVPKCTSKDTYRFSIQNELGYNLFTSEPAIIKYPPPIVVWNQKASLNINLERVYVEVLKDLKSTINEAQ